MQIYLCPRMSKQKGPNEKLGKEKVQGEDAAKMSIAELERVLANIVDDRTDLASETADETLEQAPEDDYVIEDPLTPPIIDADDLNQTVEELRQFSKRTKFSRQEVLAVRRNLIKVKFITKYAYENPDSEIADKKTLQKVWKLITDIENRLKKSQHAGLETMRDKITPKSFLGLTTTAKLQLLSNIEKCEDLEENALVVFNFGKNHRLAHQVGLDDILPAWIRVISVNGETYTRKGNQGFYRNGEYLANFNGSRITILQGDQDYSSEDDHKKLFGDRSANSSFAKIAQNFNIDGDLLEIVVKTFGPSNRQKISDPIEIAHAMGKAIQNAQAKYEAANKKSSVEDHRYTSDFLAYCLDHLNLFNIYNPNPQNKKTAFKKYSQVAGISPPVAQKEDQPREIAPEITDNNEKFARSMDHFGNTVILRKSAMLAFRRAKELAQEAGIKIRVNESYRTYQDQKALWEKRAKEFPKETKEQRAQWVAVAGISPHHTGGALDVIPMKDGRIVNYQYLYEIMPMAGFVNYAKEPWHWEIYTEMWKQQQAKTPESVTYNKHVKLDKEKVEWI